MTVLVTGGAGYIGAHVVRLLRDRGDDVVVVDDLVTGIKDRIAGSLTQSGGSRSGGLTEIVGSTWEAHVLLKRQETGDVPA